MPNKTFQEVPYYARPQCAQQSQYIPAISSTNYNQQQLYDYYYNQKPQYENSDWMPENQMKLPDKVDSIDIYNNKELSPASCCSNLDPFKDQQWYNKSYIEYPSCSQMNCEQTGGPVKYCSIKNNYDCMQQLDYNQEAFMDVLNFESMALDQQTEDSNEESDIVVEESDEESYVERKFSCTICNVVYSPVGNQFYFLTPESPLTMSSQKPVYTKLVELVGKLNEGSYLCGQCLNLVNTIDNLEHKFLGFKKDLVSKFESTNGVKVKLPQKDCVHKMTCKTCKKVISLRAVFKVHTKKHRLPVNYLCDVCGRRFTKLTKFKMHYNTHKRKLCEAVKIDAFVCKICKKPFRTKSNLNDHQNFCSNKLPFKCKLCDKSFPTSTKLKNHARLKHDKKFASICSICNLGFVKISDYKTHMISHSANKKFTCPQCGRTYKTLSNLKFHMKFHNDKLPFNCTICSKGFMRKEYLESHVNKHTGQRNFHCQICKKSFVSQKNLDAHLKYHDGNVTKKSCNVCGKLISKGLEDHMRTHSKLKEIECDKCEMRFNTKSALFKHRKRKH